MIYKEYLQHQNHQFKPNLHKLGHVSKTILGKIVERVTKSTGTNLWKNTREVFEWYRNFPNKQNARFINFDIVYFYPSITESLLHKAISYAKQYTEIQDNEIYIIIHAKRTLVFNGEGSWKKKDNNSGFDVTMGSLDEVETCELVVLHVIFTATKIWGIDRIIQR